MNKQTMMIGRSPNQMSGPRILSRADSSWVDLGMTRLPRKHNFLSRVNASFATWDHLFYYPFFNGPVFCHICMRWCTTMSSKHATTNNHYTKSVPTRARASVSVSSAHSSFIIRRQRCYPGVVIPLVISNSKTHEEGTQSY